MIIVNEEFWQSQKAQVSQIEDPDDRASTKQWLDMVEGLCTDAESLIGDMTAPAAFRAVLEASEQALGKMPVGMLAHTVILVMSVWQHGEELFDGMSYLEKRLVTDEIVRLQTPAPLEA